MNCSQSPAREPLHAAHSERGVAIVVLLYALSIFSVLALTLLRNAQLESTFRVGSDRDLHVVLYAGGAGSPRVVGRLNLPTLLRLQEGVDESVQVDAPGPLDVPLTAASPEGGVYAVQLATQLRVCCDGGTNACGDLPWEQQVPEGSIRPEQLQPIRVLETTNELRFALTSADVADNVSLDPDAVIDSPFILRATRVDDASSEGDGGTAVSCQVQTAEGALANGELRLDAGVDGSGRVTRVSSGSLRLTYRLRVPE
jgi:hypothetical protein